MAGYYLLRVFTFGLIAYVTNDSSKPTDLSLLLVDARHPPVASDGCPNSRHLPLLMYESKDGTCAPWCRLELGLCQCMLDRVRVDFPKPASNPKDMECKDLKEDVPKLKPLIGSVRRVVSACMYSDPDSGVCPFVAAQIDQIAPQVAVACKLARGGHVGEHSHESMTDRMPYRLFKFRPLSQEKWSSRDPQALATQLALVRKVADPSIHISVTSFDGTETRGLTLKSGPCTKEVLQLAARSIDRKQRKKGEIAAAPLGCIDVAIGNVPVHSEHHLLYGRCQEHGIDRDFELFEDLAQGQVELEDRAVPFDRPGEPLTQEEKVGRIRSGFCGSSLLDSFDRWLRTDQATSECSGGGLRRQN